MAAYTPPCRTVSAPTSVAVIDTSALPSWYPDAGYFNNVYRSDNGLVHLADEIDPDYFMADGSPQVYQPRVFSDAYPAFFALWVQQCGGAYNPELGARGSILLFGGGHFMWNGCGVVRFDLATGLWSNYTYPIYASTDRSIVGGTVATLTGTVQSRTGAGADNDSALRVGRSGNYYKTMDDVQIPGGGDADGNGITVWNPYPIHTNAGITNLPSDAGGGPLGSLVVVGHTQTGITMTSSKYQVFKFDCSTKLWQGNLYGDLSTSPYSTPGCEYDSIRKVMWIFPASGRPIVFDYKTDPANPARHRVNGPSLTVGNYLMTMTHMPSRDLMVFLNGSTLGCPSNKEWFRYPRIYAFRTSGYTFGSTTFNPPVFELPCSPSADYYRDQIARGLPTGWPGYRTGAQLASDEDGWMGATDIGNLIAGGHWGNGSNPLGQFVASAATNVISFPNGLTGLTVNASINFYQYGGMSLQPTGTFPGGITVDRVYYVKTIAGNNITICATPRATDGSFGVDVDITSDGGGDSYIPNAYKVRGCQDRLEYCEEDDCFIFLEKHLGTEHGVSRDEQTTINLWRLRPPPVGNEAIGPWTWEKEVIRQTAGCGGAAMVNVRTMPPWAGRARYIPELKLFYYTDRPNTPFQVIRSEDW